MKTILNIKSLVIIALAMCLIALFFWLRIRVLTATNLSANQPSQGSDFKLKNAARLFSEEKYWEARPILEELVQANPSDDQAVFGLGVALICLARYGNDPDKYESNVKQAINFLTQAKALGVEDSFLDWHLKNLSTENEFERNKEVEILASLWNMHPPEVFDHPPPDGITLPSGYRHKSSVDFEGGLSGRIWKPGGLKIHYQFAYWAGGRYIVSPDTPRIWTRRFKTSSLKFDCVLTTKNKLVISTYLLDSQNSAYADFDTTISNEQEAEEVISIVEGLKPKEGKKQWLEKLKEWIPL